MLQQDTPDDFVIATGEQHTVREFTELAFKENGIILEWQGTGLDEVGVDAKNGKVLVTVNSAFFRPTDVVNLCGDPTKAKKILGWNPQQTLFTDLVHIMAQADRQLTLREKTYGKGF